MLPGAPAVEGFVDAVSGRKIGPAQALAAADIDNLRIRRRNRQRAYRTCRLIVKDRIPGVSVIGALPDAAVVRSHKKDIRLAGDPADGDGAASAKWTD